MIQEMYEHFTGSLLRLHPSRKVVNTGWIYRRDILGDVRMEVTGEQKIGEEVRCLDLRKFL